MAGETVIITIVGNLTADPEIRTTSTGAQVASFTIASTPRVFDRQSNQYVDGQALFMRCSAWRDLAEHCARSLGEGHARDRPGKAHATLLRGQGRHEPHGRGTAGG